MKKIIFCLVAHIIFLNHILSQTTKILIQTDLGDIKFFLYDETPLHRDNFIKLTKEKYFDSLLFHRVIKNFVVQGGDPDSKNAPSGKLLGEGGPAYTIPKEFMPEKYYHKKGVIGAGRDYDILDTSLSSSPSQFYIVIGKIQNDSLLNKHSERIAKADYFLKWLSQTQNIHWIDYCKKLKAEKKDDSLMLTYKNLMQSVEKTMPALNVNQMNKDKQHVYKTLGGLPHLDGRYTVFGEIYEGLDVAEKISLLPTDKNDRPMQDIRMKVSIIE